MNTPTAEEMYDFFREQYREAGEIYPYDGQEGGFQGSNYVDCRAGLAKHFPQADPATREEVAQRLDEEGNWVDPLEP
jgi:hypothetical protein